MATYSPKEITRLLLAWGNGDQAALENLIPMIYEELRRLARRHMRGERANHTLQTTALVHEAYVRMIDSSQTQWQDRSHFFAVASQLMRRILVDFARGRKNLKRGGGAIQVTLSEALGIPQERGADLVALDGALNALAQLDPRQSRVVELRFFGGLSVEETAEALKVSTETVKRDWRLAKVWLLRELGQGGGGDDS
jgi:RNA polymerase sigma factor (TIGR02999 family)